MIELSVAIQHAPWIEQRQRWVEAIGAVLRAERPKLAITIAADVERRGCWASFRAGLEAATDSCTHHVMLQDDLELCAEFVAAVEGAIAARPDTMLCLYTNSIQARRSRDRGFAWIQLHGGAGPAMVWPRALIDEFLDWEAEHIAPSCEFDTIRVSMWMLKTGKPVFATLPSLVQHLAPMHSVLGLHDPQKIAPAYDGSATSAAAIDWSVGLDACPRDHAGLHMRFWRDYVE